MGRRRRRVVSLSSEQTRQFGKELAKELAANQLICFFGDLGAGKTTLIKGIVEQLTSINGDEVTSPTYTYLQSYEHVHHFDLYRLDGVDGFKAMGFEEYLDSGVCCIEWSEKIESLIPKTAMKITLSHLDDNKRQIEVA